jgi:surface antigen
MRLNRGKETSRVAKLLTWPFAVVALAVGIATAVPATLVVMAAGTAAAGTDTYPSKWATAPMDSLIDNWGEYNRECTSYAAWMLHSVNGFEMPFHDNAVNWGPDARARGYSVNSTPAVGSVYWTSTPQHVAWVESVNSNGTVTIEDYNSDYTGHWREHSVAASSASGYIHFKDLAGGGTSADYFIKTKNTGSGHVEIHSATAASGYKNGVHYATAFSQADAGNGWFSSEDVNGDSRADLVFIKTKNTGSGHVEYFILDGARSYSAVTSANVTWFSPADADNGWFQEGSKS